MGGSISCIRFFRVNELARAWPVAVLQYTHPSSTHSGGDPG